MSRETASGAGMMPVPQVQQSISPDSSQQHSGAGGVSLLPTTKAIADAIAKCGTRAITTNCKNEGDTHYWVKRLYCGQEWCPTCGAKDSATHNRRVSKWVPKAQQLESMAYLVVEWPIRYREIGRVAEYAGDRRADPDDVKGWVYSQEALRWSTDKIVEVLAGRRMGRRGRVGGWFGRGLARWHFFGDKQPGWYNPHLNILVDGGRLSKANLAALKGALREALGVPDLIVNYHYTKRPAQMVHWVKYVTRATFLQYDWNPYLARQLYKFRNCRTWGTWKDAPVWDMTPEIEAEAGAIEKLMSLGSGICPCCHHELEKWSRPFSSKWIEVWNGAEIPGTGYYLLPNQDYHSDDFTPAMAMQLSRLEREAKERRSVLVADGAMRFVAENCVNCGVSQFCRRAKSKAGWKSACCPPGFALNSMQGVSDAA